MLLDVEGLMGMPMIWYFESGNSGGFADESVTFIFCAALYLFFAGKPVPSRYEREDIYGHSSKS